MFTPRCTPVCLSRASAPAVTLPRRFSLLVWNVQKTAFEHLFLCGLDTAHDLYAFQEATLSCHQPATLPWPWAMTPNLHRGHRHHGVMTASRTPFRIVTQQLTQRREWLLRTYKGALLTLHPLPDDRQLALLNVHMLLTTSRRAVQQELAALSRLLGPHAGPLIVTGDFNTWSRPRLRQLDQWADRLGLVHARLSNAHAIKQVGRYPLDHILWRGLVLESAHAVESPCSDHNPLVARFTLLPT